MIVQYKDGRMVEVTVNGTDYEDYTIEAYFVDTNLELSSSELDWIIDKYALEIQDAVTDNLASYGDYLYDSWKEGN